MADHHPSPNPQPYVFSRFFDVWPNKRISTKSHNARVIKHHAAFLAEKMKQHTNGTASSLSSLSSLYCTALPVLFRALRFAFPFVTGSSTSILSPTTGPFRIETPAG